MKDPNPSAERLHRKPAVLFVVGLVAGAAVGVIYGSGRFSRERERVPRPSSDESAVTYHGSAASSNGPASGMLAGLLGAGSAGSLDRTRAVLAFVDGVKSGDFAVQIDEVFARRRGNQGYDLIANLYQKWVESDPAAALRHAEGLEVRNRNAALNAVLSAWAAKEPYQVIAWVEEHGNSQESRSALHSALRAIAQDDPEAAIALAEGSKFVDRSNTSFLYGIWAEKDPRAAASRALSIPHAQERRNALWSLASQWALADPQAAWDWGNGLERVSERDAVLRMVVGAVVGTGDTSQAIAFLEAMPHGQGRQQALERIATSLAGSDPEQAYEFLRRQASTSGEEQAYSSILSQWARSDPARAFQIALEELDPGNARNSAIQSVLNEVANRDVALALDMLGKLDEGSLRQASYSVPRTLARNDRGAALAWAETLPGGDNKQNAFSGILSEWAEEAPPGGQ